MNASEVEAYLDDATVKVLTWKPGIVTDIACRIASDIVSRGEAWADEIDLGFVPEASRNCIGLAWRLLTKAGIIERGTRFRRSEKDGSKGRTIFVYWLASSGLASSGLAKTFLSRNRRVPVTGHGELPPDDRKAA